MAGRRPCAYLECGEKLPEDAHHRQKYCDEECRDGQAEIRKRQAKRERSRDLSFSNLTEDNALRGPRQRVFAQTDLPHKIVAGQMTFTEAADIFLTDVGSVRGWVAAFLMDNEGAELKIKEARAPKKVEGGLIEFRKRFFPDYLIPDAHVEWSNLIEDTLDDGGRTMLLAPQRHGKSEMLIHQCLKLIMEDPNLRVGWVSKTAGLAEKMVGHMRIILETHDGLREFYNHGEKFEPGYRSGLPWTSSEFTLNSRTKVLKTPTVTALGSGGTIVGRDFDIIVLDDPQDRKRCGSPTMREKDWEWFSTDFMSRVEEDTPVVFIMSRQHEDDLPGRIMADHADMWRIAVYQAHDPACTIDERETAKHTDCVLWPEKRTFKWLMEQKSHNKEHFQRNYMNNPQSDQLTFLRPSDLENRKSEMHEAGASPGGTLVAGIDPAAAKPTAAVLWASIDGKRYLVDALEAAPGTEGVRDLVESWRRMYGCRTFVVESNGYQGQIVHDSELRQMCSKMGVRMIPQYTSRINKHDPDFGVVAMLQELSSDDSVFVLPGIGDERALERIDRLYRQWLIFDPDTTNHKHAKDDLVMASWIPQQELERIDRKVSNKVVWLGNQTNYGQTTYGDLYAGAY